METIQSYENSVEKVHLNVLSDPKVIHTEDQEPPVAPKPEAHPSYELRLELLEQR